MQWLCNHRISVQLCGSPVHTEAAPFSESSGLDEQHDDCTTPSSLAIRLAARDTALNVSEAHLHTFVGMAFKSSGLGGVSADTCSKLQQ